MLGWSHAHFLAVLAHDRIREYLQCCWKRMTGASKRDCTARAMPAPWKGDGLASRQVGTTAAITREARLHGSIRSSFTDTQLIDTPPEARFGRITGMAPGAGRPHVRCRERPKREHARARRLTRWSGDASPCGSGDRRPQPSQAVAAETRCSMIAVTGLPTTTRD